MKVELRESAQKDYRKLPPTEKDRIKSAILGLENFPNVPGIKKLTNFSPAYRKRVGDYRILFDVFEQTVFVARIRHRKDVYDT